MRAVFRNNRIFIYDSFIHKESIKQITGRMWHPEDKAWSVPVVVESLEILDLLACNYPLSESPERHSQKKLCIPSELSDMLFSE